MNKPVKWRKVSEAQKCDFQVSLCDSLKSKADAIPTESIPNFIDKLYHCIVMSINDASDAELPHSCYRPYLKPYWSTDLRKYHTTMRNQRTEGPESRTDGETLIFWD